MGKMIVIEGMDGAGTTTQSKLLLEYLSSIGHSVLRTQEPTKSAFGQEIRRWLSSPIENEPYLLTMLALAFAADRMHHVHHVLVPALKDHDFVIVDRYVLSSLVYQGLHLPTSFISEINKFALMPDMTVVLDIPASVALERLSNRPGHKDFYESRSLLEKIRSRYVHLVNENPEQYFLIDSSGSIDEVHQELIKETKQRFPL